MRPSLSRCVQVVAVASIVCVTNANGNAHANDPAPAPWRRAAQFIREIDRLALATAVPTAAHELLKRQTTAPPVSFTVTVAPDKTCGFLSASPGNAITCPGSANCMWESDQIDAIFCMNGLDVVAYTQCIEREVATDPSRCNDICESNEFNLLCINSAAPFCRTYAYPGGVKGFACASTRVLSTQSADFTYLSQTNRGLSTMVISDPPASTIPTRSTTPTTISSSSALSATTTTVSPTPQPSSVNKGAIIGGVVGGVAGLGLIAAAVLLLIRRRKPQNPQVSETNYGHQAYPIDPNTGQQISQYVPDKGMQSPDISSQYGSTSPSSPGFSGASFVTQPRIISQSYPPPDDQNTPYQNPSLPLQPVSVQQVADLRNPHHRGQLHEMS